MNNFEFIKDKFKLYKEKKNTDALKHRYGIFTGTASVIFATLFALSVIINSRIPDTVTVFSDCNGVYNSDYVCAVPFTDVSKNISSSFCENYEIKLLGALTAGKTEVREIKHKTVTLGGMNFGVLLHTKGALIVGMSDIESDSGKSNPAYNAGMRIGDFIEKINGSDVKNISAVTDAVFRSEGNPLKFQVNRDGEALEFTVTPEKCKTDGIHKIGLWIRDSTAGIGTVTFILPENGIFGGLGHGIYDSDTGKLLPVSDGSVYGVKISGINKGNAGAPGEIKGRFSTSEIGRVLENKVSGIYGKIDDADALYSDSAESMEIGLSDEVKEGEAFIRSYLSDGTVHNYKAVISSVSGDCTESKSFIIEIADDDLISVTGGIIQGMSGSPVIQNGKLIGAVTHVMINNPKKGYGIFIENMLYEAEKLN